MSTNLHSSQVTGVQSIFFFTFFSINGEVWNEAEVVKYLRFVYHPSRIVIEDKIKKILEELKEKLNSKSDSIFDEAHDKLVGYCQRR